MSDRLVNLYSLRVVASKFLEKAKRESFAHVAFGCILFYASLFRDHPIESHAEFL
jgi:hypothetical protein